MDQGITRIQEVVRALTVMNRDVDPQEAISIHELGQELQALLLRALEAQGIRLEQAIDPGLQVSGPEAEVIRQVLFNLLMNGLDASPRGGVLRIEGSRLGPHLEVRVIDEGPGIPDHLREAIWSLGFSTKRATVTGGLTPSLALGRSLLRELGGDLILHPQAPGVGACFSITLPLSPMGGTGGAPPQP